MKNIKEYKTPKDNDAIKYIFDPTKIIKDLIRISKALGLMKSARPILRYARVNFDTIQITDLETTYEIENVIIDGVNDGDKDVLIHLPTLEKCYKLGFKKMTYKQKKDSPIGFVLVDNETGVSVDLPRGKLEDYPNVPVFSNYSTEGFVRNEIRSDDILAVGLAVAGERSRFAIDGMAVYPNGTLAATDGRRMHIKGKVSEDKPAILPSSVVKLCKILKFDEFDTTIETNPESEYAIIAGDIGVIGFKVIQGRYPAIHRIIPIKKQPLKIEVAKLLPILKRIAKVHGGMDPMGVKFNNQISWNGINFPFKLPKGLNHIFNFSYLIEALEITKAKYFTLSKDNHMTIKIENDGMVAIITPINIVT